MAFPTAKRQYEPIWDQLKLTGKATIAAPIPLHPRIKKAVLKEKWMDLGYKVILAETAQRATLEIKANGAKLVFVLRKSIGIGDI